MRPPYLVQSRLIWYRAASFSTEPPHLVQSRLICMVQRRLIWYRAATIAWYRDASFGTEVPHLVQNCLIWCRDASFGTEPPHSVQSRLTWYRAAAFGTEPPHLVQSRLVCFRAISICTEGRLNKYRGLTLLLSGLGYLEVGLNWPHNAPPGQWACDSAVSCWTMWTVLIRHVGKHSDTALLEPLMWRSLVRVPREEKTLLYSNKNQFSCKTRYYNS
jgi:hypothetical protein